jgi:predicted nucleic acid-binding protein
MYAHDTAAGAKHERAKALVEELWCGRTGVVSTQVLRELSVNLHREGATATRSPSAAIGGQPLAWGGVSLMPR